LLLYILDNMSAPEFIGPIITDNMDFHFICRIVYNDSQRLGFDVALLFDGEQIPAVAEKSAISTSSLDVIFTSQDFAGQYGKLVCNVFFI